MREIEIPQPLQDVLLACECYCTAHCCGLAAFQIESDAILRAGGLADPSVLSDAQEQLAALVRQLEKDSDPVSCEVLDYEGAGMGLVETIECWRPAIREALERVEQGTHGSAEPDPARSPGDWPEVYDGSGAEVVQALARLRASGIPAVHVPGPPVSWNLSKETADRVHVAPEDADSARRMLFGEEDRKDEALERKYPYVVWLGAVFFALFIFLFAYRRGSTQLVTVVGFCGLICVIVYLRGLHDQTPKQEVEEDDEFLVATRAVCVGVAVLK